MGPCLPLVTRAPQLHVGHTTGTDRIEIVVELESLRARHARTFAGRKPCRRVAGGRGRLAFPGGNLPCNRRHGLALYGRIRSQLSERLRTGDVGVYYGAARSAGVGSRQAPARRRAPTAVPPGRAGLSVPADTH